MQPEVVIDKSKRIFIERTATAGSSQIQSALESATTLFDPGTISRIEDYLIFNPEIGVLGLFDGTSEVHTPSTGVKKVFEVKSPQSPMKDFHLVGAQGGALLARNLLNRLKLEGNADVDLKSLLSKINRALSEYFKSHTVGDNKNIYGTTPASKPAMGGVIARLNPETECLEIAAWGDVRAAWRTQDGKVNITDDQLKLHDAEMYEKIAEIRAKCGDDKSAMWDEFAPFLEVKRNERVNNHQHPKGYCVLNGDTSFLEAIQYFEIPIREVSTLVLFTDGMVNRHPAETPDDLAQDVISAFEQGNISRFLDETRKREQAASKVSHVAHGEASFIGLRF
ncbi:MAG: hypothetical protein R3A13_04025 [Bdellovibrionota bacterium]